MMVVKRIIKELIEIKELLLEIKENQKQIMRNINPRKEFSHFL